jgi:hypothetical protein
VTRDELSRLREHLELKARRKASWRASWKAHDEERRARKRGFPPVSGQSDPEAERAVLAAMARAARPIATYEVAAAADHLDMGHALRIHEAVHALRRSGLLVEPERKSKLFALAPREEGA